MAENEQEPFIMIPDSVLQDNRLSDRDKIIYGVILGLTRLYGYCFGSNSKIGARVNVNGRNTQSHIKSLLQNGLIDVTYTGEHGAGRRIYLKTPPTCTGRGTPESTGTQSDMGSNLVKSDIDPYVATYPPLPDEVLPPTCSDMGGVPVEVLPPTPSGTHKRISKIDLTDYPKQEDEIIVSPSLRSSPKGVAHIADELVNPFSDLKAPEPEQSQTAPQIAPIIPRMPSKRELHDQWPSLDYKERKLWVDNAREQLAAAGLSDLPATAIESRARTLWIEHKLS